jgi:hypothetical protein
VIIGALIALAAAGIGFAAGRCREMPSLRRPDLLLPGLVGPEILPEFVDPSINRPGAPKEP